MRSSSCSMHPRSYFVTLDVRIHRTSYIVHRLCAAVESGAKADQMRSMSEVGAVYIARQSPSSPRHMPASPTSLVLHLLLRSSACQQPPPNSRSSSSVLLLPTGVVNADVVLLAAPDAAQPDR